MSMKRWRESSPYMQECKIKIENEPKMQANMQSGSLSILLGTSWDHTTIISITMKIWIWSISDSNVEINLSIKDM